MKAGFKVADVDLHLIEPPDLWERSLPEPYRSRTRVLRPEGGQDGGFRFQVGDVIVGNAALNEWEKLVMRQSRRVLATQPHLARTRRECTPEVYLEGMDIEGIDVGMVLPTITFLATTWDGLDPQHVLAMCQAYNDFAGAFARACPDRLRFWAWLPRQDPKLAALEARRCVEELGAVGVAMTQRAVDGHLLSDEIFDPLWAELSRLGRPIGIHVGGSTPKDDIRARYEGHRRSGLVSRAVIRQFYAATTVSEMILGGVLEAYPRLQLVIMESAVSWLPWLLGCMDELAETYRPELDAPLALAPSEYFRRQCFAVADCNERAARHLVAEGFADRLMLSTDYPHHDSPFPHAIQTFVDDPWFEPEVKRKMLWDNAARFFGL